MSGKGFTTRAVHSATAGQVNQRPASVPIYQTATWGLESSQEFAEILESSRPGYSYGRGYGNPTVEAFESVIADLEGTKAAFGFSSGMSAISATVMSLVSSGDRILASSQLYGGTYALFSKVLPRYGVRTEEVSPLDVEAVRAALPGAALFYVETISNPTCTVPDLAALVAACRDAGVPTVIDNTFASPWLCCAGALGFDFVIHSVTKYIAGHSDVIGGVVCCSTSGRAGVREVALNMGGAMQPFDAWLSIRGVQTLEVRMERQSRSAMELASWLESSPGVRHVDYPGLPSSPSHDVAVKLLREGHFGGMLSFEVDGGIDEAAQWCEHLKVGWIGASLGGTHTLVAHPASTTHRQVPSEERVSRGLPDGLIRVSVGLENSEDLLADFAQAFA